MDRSEGYGDGLDTQYLHPRWFLTRLPRRIHTHIYIRTFFPYVRTKRLLTYPIPLALARPEASFRLFLSMLPYWISHEWKISSTFLKGDDRASLPPSSSPRCVFLFLPPPSHPLVFVFLPTNLTAGVIAFNVISRRSKSDSGRSAWGKRERNTKERERERSLDEQQIVVSDFWIKCTVKYQRCSRNMLKCIDVSDRNYIYTDDL